MEEARLGKRSASNLGDLEVIVEHSARKVRLLAEFLNHRVSDDELWSKDAKAGFHFVLNDIEDDLEFISTQLCKVGLITPIMKKTEAT